MVNDVEMGTGRQGVAEARSEASDASEQATVKKGFEAPKMSANSSAVDLKMAAAALPPPPAIQPTTQFFPPGDVYRSFQANAIARMNAEYFTLAAMGLTAGAYVAFAFCFCLTAVGTTGVLLLGALAFPTGILLIILCGGDLYTGNTAFFFTAHLEGQANWWHHIKGLVGTYFWNLVGSLVIVGLCLGGSVWKGRENYVHSFAHNKMALTWGECVCRGIMANWMVNLSLWQAASARDITGKVVGCWIPVTCFVMIGLEHCVANMFVIPMSIYLDPTEKYPNTITWAAFIRKNLIPATIGNWIGGAIMVGFLAGCIHGRNIPRWKNMAWDATLGKVIPKLP